VSLLVLAEFAVADYFGVRTLGTEIFAIVSTYLDPSAALAAARPLFVFSLFWVGLLGLSAWRLRRMRLPPVLPVASSGSSRGSVLMLASLAAMVLLVPLAVLVHTLVGGSAPAGELLWRATRLASKDVLSGLVVATAVAMLATIMALGAAHSASMSHRKSNAPRFVALMALATPTTLWAIGAVMVASTSGTGWLVPMIVMLSGMVLHVLAPATELIAVGLRSIPALHIEAACVSGLAAKATWRRVVLPQASGALLLAFSIAWIWSLNDVTLSVLLGPPGFSTLMVRIFQTVHYGPPELLAAYSLVHLVAIGLCAGIAAFVARRFPRSTS
jgi:ABC-type Fe3+ transport system permease subunit